MDSYCVSPCNFRWRTTINIFRCHGNEIHQANVWLRKQRNKIHKPWQQACCNICIGVLLLVSFTTRRALDVLNCNPVDPDDGYLYTEFTSKDCEAGCCNDPDELQQRLVPFAAACLLIYSIGFPVYVAYITWYYRIQIKLDQLLRAHDLGDRAHSIDSVHFTKRKGRSQSRRIFDIRKKHHQLYYHFKPGKVYWLTVVLMKSYSLLLLHCYFVVTSYSCLA